MGARKDKERPITNKTHVRRIDDLPPRLASALEANGITTLGAMKGSPDVVRKLLLTIPRKERGPVEDLLKPRTQAAPRQPATASVS